MVDHLRILKWLSFIFLMFAFSCSLLAGSLAGGLYTVVLLALLAPSTEMSITVRAIAIFAVTRVTLGTKEECLED